MRQGFYFNTTYTKIVSSLSVKGIRRILIMYGACGFNFETMALCKQIFLYNHPMLFPLYFHSTHTHLIGNSHGIASEPLRIQIKGKVWTNKVGPRGIKTMFKKLPTFGVVHGKTLRNFTFLMYRKLSIMCEYLEGRLVTCSTRKFQTINHKVFSFPFWSYLQARGM